MTYFFGFLCSGLLDFNFLKIGPLVTLSCPSLVYGITGKVTSTVTVVVVDTRRNIAKASTSLVQKYRSNIAIYFHQS
jgi:hypothetical protein